MKCNIPERDLAQKLDQTICRYDGKPVYVRVAGREIYAYPVTRRDTGEPQRIMPEDPKFDISGIQLGYVNGVKTLNCFYLSRIPVRKVKQGLTVSAIRMSALPGYIGKDGGYTTQQIVYSKGFEDMVLGKYPSLENALKGLRDANAKDGKSTYQIAVSREIALMIDANALVHVFFKNQLVGWIEPNKFVVHVKNGELSWVISRYLAHVLGWVID